MTAPAEQLLLGLPLPWMRLSWAIFFIVTGFLEAAQGGRGLFLHRRKGANLAPHQGQALGPLAAPLSDYGYHTAHGTAYALCGFCELIVAASEFGLLSFFSITEVLTIVSSTSFVTANVIGVYQGTTSYRETWLIQQEYGNTLSSEEKKLCGHCERSATLSLVNSCAYLIAWPTALVGGYVGIVAVFAFIAVSAGTARLLHDWLRNLSYSRLAELKLSVLHRFSGQ